MQTHTQDSRGHGLIIAVLAGTAVGAGFAFWIAQRVSAPFRERMAGSVTQLGQRTSDEYQTVSARAGEAVGAMVRTGRGVRHGLAGAVARGAHEVERYAMAAGGAPVADVAAPPAP